MKTKTKGFKSLAPSLLDYYYLYGNTQQTKLNAGTYGYALLGSNPDARPAQDRGVSSLIAGSYKSSIRVFEAHGEGALPSPAVSYLKPIKDF